MGQLPLGYLVPHYAVGTLRGQNFLRIVVVPVPWYIQ